MILSISPDGTTQCLYTEDIDLGAMGSLAIYRASFVEPLGDLWWADMGPSGGPELGPYATRSEALAAEVAWLEEHVL
jgi:hypothetical protein